MSNTSNLKDLLLKAKEDMNAFLKIKENIDFFIKNNPVDFETLCFYKNHMTSSQEFSSQFEKIICRALGLKRRGGCSDFDAESKNGEMIELKYATASNTGSIRFPQIYRPGIEFDSMIISLFDQNEFYMACISHDNFIKSPLFKKSKGGAHYNSRERQLTFNKFNKSQLSECYSYILDNRMTSYEDLIKNGMHYIK